MKPGISNNIKLQQSEASSWIPHFPNPADFRFDYFKLLQESSDGVASLPSGTKPKVAVIGAGAAGMTTARELMRSGYEVTIFEASSRIGGRLYTRENPLNSTDNLSHAGMEMGAMRMPFFGWKKEQEDHQAEIHNSILGYYLNYEPSVDNRAILTPFPNPGAAPGNTGVYLNNGYGPQGASSTTPQLINWPDGGNIDNSVLNNLNDIAGQFGSNFQIPANMFYTKDTDEWTQCWTKMVAHYESMSFNDLVLEDAKSTTEIEQALSNLETFDGDLGGFGMNAEQADLLYTIGTGDGSWGAFYSIGALWFLRCTYFGFDSDLQTVEGFNNPSAFPFYNEKVYDNSTPPQLLTPPIYEGIQSLVEYLYYCEVPGGSSSLRKDATLYVNCSVDTIEKSGNGVKVYSSQTPNGEEFDNVVVSATQWAAQLSINFKGFSQEELPQAKITTSHTQHNISSCKLFFPLNETYWTKEGHKIPQLIVTDTIVQDLYGLTWDSKPNDKGVLLASYTWEDDSLKLLPFDEQKLAEIVLARLAEITLQTTGEDITKYIDKTKPVSIQWITEPNYIGCSKLYRAHNESGNMLDLAYNQTYSQKSNLYFAGENYGVEGGWTEPALRSAMDCVVQMVKNTEGAKFNCATFNEDTDYPTWPITVFATSSWLDTGIYIPKGSNSTITYISGQWTANPEIDNGELYGPEGVPITAKPGYAMPGANEGALVGRIGEGEPFLIGRGVTIPSDLEGNLKVVINDDLNGEYGKGLTDNQGNLIFRVHVS